MTAYAFSFGVLADMLHGAGFEIRRHASLGFGPFTMFAAPLLPERVGLAVHRRLQAMADRGVSILSATGAQHLVLATLTAPAYQSARSLPEPRSAATVWALVHHPLALLRQSRICLSACESSHQTEVMRPVQESGFACP